MSKSTRKFRRMGPMLSGVLAGWLVMLPIQGVDGVQAADVTTRSFSVVWVDDEPIQSATVQIFADAAGTMDISSGLGQLTTSAAVAGAHDLGVAKVDVSGLLPDTCYYYRTETTTASGIEVAPIAGPYPEVCTAQTVSKILPAEQPISNDLIRHDVAHPDGISSSGGVLVLLAAPDVGAYPVSAFVGDSAAQPRAVLDLNNLFASGTGDLLSVGFGEILQITEYRGLLCPEPMNQERTRYVRAPEHEETLAIGVPIVEIERGGSCFFVDTMCDDTIDILDAQRVLNAFGASPDGCRFNPDLDVVADLIINVLDVQSVLNRLGENAPFDP